MRESTIPLTLCVLSALSVIVSAQTNPPPVETIAVTAAPPYSAIGELFILRADTNRMLLHDPVLVVEGFDISNDMNWPELYALLNQENLVDDLQAYGRDLVVLNFGDSTVDILANSALTETAVQFINANRADPGDKFTAVGASLGGLTIRKALVDLPGHDVNTWISFDGPHEGANIPLGVQEFFEHFSAPGLPGDFDAIRKFLQALDSPASRQLLLVHHTHSPDAPAGASSPERQDFVAAMSVAGYPTNCKSIAISNGSGYGEKLPLNPGQLVFHWFNDGPFLFGPDLDADIYALPQSANTADIVFRGIFTSILGSVAEGQTDSCHPLPLDNAPGGYRSTFLQVYTNLPYTGDGDDLLTATNHCFIPTVSALGIPIENIESNLSVHADLLALSPFDEVHFGLANEEHVEINPRNKRWIMRAALEERDSDGDGYDDYEEYLLGTDYASADSLPGVYAVVEVAVDISRASLAWGAFPHTQYDVWYAAELGEPWQWMETIPPGTNSVVTRSYLIDTETPTGFFKIRALVVDPGTD